MRLTAFTDYSLRVLIYLDQAPEGRATIAEIAAAYGISEHHLVKVVHLLGREGVLVNTRGRRGGVRLARAADRINVGKVVRLTERGDRLAGCFDRARNDCALAGGCGLQKALCEAMAGFYAALERYTVADLHVKSDKLSRIFPRPRA